MSFIVGTEIQGLLVINDSSYVFERWHGTLLVIAVGVFCLLFNTFLARWIPVVENIGLILHLTGFVAILTTLWVMGAKSSASTVFFEFNDGGDWGNIGLSCLVGMLSATFSFGGARDISLQSALETDNLIGPDSAVHMCKQTSKGTIYEGANS